VKRALLLIALAVVLALPFALRPARRPSARAEDLVVVITSHNEAIRREIASGFAEWYRARTGRSVAVDWRVIGGTSDIARFLASAYDASFELHWTRTLGQPWSAAVQAAYANPRLPENAPAAARRAREEFLRSEVGCGVDVFFGGGSYDHVLQASAGRLVPAAVFQRHPEWFRDAVIPQHFAGEEYWDAAGRWAGTVLSNYGILYNRDSLHRLGLPHPPTQWSDLADPRFLGEVALADPMKSSSMAKALENIIQQQMQLALRRESGAGLPAADAEARAVREGWLEGLRLIQRIGANARYFSDSAQKVPIDVAQGDCAAGICIDFYGRAQAEVTAQRDARAGGGRLAFVTPRGGTVSSVDPIALLRGAPHRAAAEAFIEYTLTLDAQKRWNFRPGTPGGPEVFALRRLPVRRDFYQHTEWLPLRSDPEADPFGETDQLIYQPAWTAHLFREMELLIRVMVQDTRPELVRAWRAILAAPPERRTAALAALQDLGAVSYDRVAAELTPAVASRDPLAAVRQARQLGDLFRRNYARAEQLARP
jgi:ABC-type Fe3+ transport system substrate-binding protein